MSKDSQLVVWLTELGVGEDVVEAVRIAQFVFQQLAIFLIDFFYQVSGWRAYFWWCHSADGKGGS